MRHKSYNSVRFAENKNDNYTKITQTSCNNTFP